MGISRFLIDNFARNRAIEIGIFFKGRKIIMPDKLNRRCVNETVTAATEPVDSAAKIAVMVVPTFAPSIYGKTCSSLRISAAISGITRDVVTELLCTNTVKISPNSKLLSMVRKIYLSKKRFEPGEEDRFQNFDQIAQRHKQQYQG